MVTTILNQAHNNPQVEADNIFDASDIDYLVGLGENELKRILRNYDVRRAFFLAEHWPGSQYCREYGFSYELGLAAKLALDIIGSRRRRPIAKHQRKQVDVSALKESCDILEIAGRYTRLLPAGRNFKGLCPFHNETKPSFFIFPDRQSWHCFGACSTGGDVVSLIIRAEHTDFKGALTILGGVF